MSQVEHKNSSPLRQGVVLSLLALAMVLLLCRAFYLHVSDRDFLQGQGDARYQRVVTLQAHRGMIQDRFGDPLAISTPVDSVWAHPGELAQAQDRWKELGKLLDIDVKGLVSGRQDKEFIYLRRHIDPEHGQKVMALQIPGVALQREYRRYYPFGEVTSHVIGFTNVDDAGQEGIELAYNQMLSGKPGSKRVIRDRLGRIVEDVEAIRSPDPGKDVTLSIDRRIQYLAYRELKAAVQRHHARAGAAVVLDVNTGEVLAMVNQPSFNPNNRSELKGDRYRNRAVTDLIEPGSTIKPFTVAAALDAGSFNLASQIDTSPGYMRVSNSTVKDFRNYGVVDLRTLIQKSSNVGAAKLSLQTEPERFWSVLAGVGFGTAPGSGFPGEAGGLLPHYTVWHKTQRVTLSYGYGLSATPLQLAQSYAVLGNGGRQVSPRFIPPAGEGMAEAGVQVITSQSAAQVRSMMESVVQAGGTGTQAAVPGYRVAGKTGTVRKSGVGGYQEDRYLSVFAGVAPARSPRLAMVVIIDEPAGEMYYGGDVAAPVFGQVMAGALRLMDVAPDDLPGMGAKMASAGGWR